MTAHALANTAPAPLLLEQGEDQAFFRSTTARFLDDRAPVSELRRLREDPAGFTSTYWQQGAELGWTSLLVREEHGGGSISGSGVIDLALVAHEFGRHAAPGPLTPVNVVAAALSATATHHEVLAELLDGSAIATWAHGAAITTDGEGDDIVITGTVRPVESAAQARYLLVSDHDTQVLVPTSSPGLGFTTMRSVDLTRRFAAVTFDNVRLPLTALVGVAGRAADQVRRQQQLALVLANAESVGAMQAAFEMTTAWAFDRYSFGRPLASYQALKHRFADMFSWLQASHAIADNATAALSSGAPAAEELLSATKAYVGNYGGELLQECVQLHGGIGVTFEHDLHLYLRRHTVNTALYGTPAQHRQRLADFAESRGVNR